ncbi:serine hydrolase [Candidatus Bipolaricaulota bacterium]|nr:serine hydrolase [Candidatus Bipolaricaulota bacterium]
MKYNLKRIKQTTCTLKTFLLILTLFFLTIAISPTATATETPTLTRKDVEPFLNGVIASQLKQHNIPGAAVSVVSGKEIIFSDGYGRPNVEIPKTASPDDTIFRSGSVSKLFIWTAIAQLLDQGKLELDRDINAYLEEVTIPNSYERPITIWNLMTHTSGFEEKGIHLYAPSAEKLLPLVEALEKNQPARVRPPGEIVAYSNYGTALAGRIVTNVSGKNYKEYLRENIFEPLEMNRSSFRQPIPETLSGTMAKGYRYKNGQFVEGKFEFIQLGPAGAMSSTAKDMGNFMIAHLNKGRFRGREILTPEIADRLHSRQLAGVPEAGGMTMGLIEIFINDKRLILHGGDTDLFHSGMFLIPEENVGIYVSYNAPGGGVARLNLLEAFLDRYFPTSARKENVPVTTNHDEEYTQSINEFTGSYAPTRSNFTTFEKVRKILSPIKVKKSETGKLNITGLGTGPTAWVRIGERVFQNASFKSNERIFFSDKQESDYLFLENNPTTALIKLPWWGNYSLQLAIPVVVSAFFLLYFFSWFLAVTYRRVYQVKRTQKSLLFRTVRWIAGVTMACFLIFLAGFSLSAGSEAIIYGLFPLALASLIFGMVGAVTLVVLSGLVIMSWIKGKMSLTHKLGWSAIVLFGLVFVWWMNYWNLLGVRI